MPLRLEVSTATPASTYSISVAIKYSYPRWWLCRAVDLWARLLRTVEASLLRGLPLHDDRPGQAPALVVAGTGAVPVVARAVELEGGGSARVVHQPDELGVTVARQARAVRVLVIVDELELEHAPVGHDEDPGLVDQLVLGDPHGGAHLSVGPLLGVSDFATPEYSSESRSVLLVQIRQGLGSHGSPSLGSDAARRLLRFRPRRLSERNF